MGFLLWFAGTGEIRQVRHLWEVQAVLISGVLAATVGREVQLFGCKGNTETLFSDLRRRRSQQAYLTEVALVGTKWLRINTSRKRRHDITGGEDIPEEEVEAHNSVVHTLRAETDKETEEGKIRKRGTMAH